MTSAQVVNDVAWSVSFTGASDGDYSLEAMEHAILSVWLVADDYGDTSGLCYTLGSSTADPFLDVEADLLPTSPASRWR